MGITTSVFEVVRQTERDFAEIPLSILSAFTSDVRLGTTQRAGRC
jgi:hypothetical protein